MCLLFGFSSTVDEVHQFEGRSINQCQHVCITSLQIAKHKDKYSQVLFKLDKEQLKVEGHYLFNNAIVRAQGSRQFS